VSRVSDGLAAPDWTRSSPSARFAVDAPSLFAAIFERLRNILHESAIDKRVQYMIEVMFAIRKDGFKDHPVILEGLDLVDEGDQFTHMLPLDDEYDTEELLSKKDLRRTPRASERQPCVILTCVCVCVHSDVFKMDPDFLESEEKYKTIKRGQNAHRHQTGQSAVTSPLGLTNRLTPSRQTSWTRAAATRGRTATAATKRGTKKRRTRRREQVRPDCGGLSSRERITPMMSLGLSQVES